jgi:hypothetical protein
MTTKSPTVGDRVLYTLGPGDVRLIDEQSPMVVDGHQVRNSVHEGDVYPADVIRVWSAESGCANLRVLLDGRADYWATSRAWDNPEVDWTPRYSPTPDHDGPGHAGGTWHWPERV